MGASEPSLHRLQFVNMQRQESEYCTDQRHESEYCADRHVMVVELAVDTLGAVQEVIVLQNHAERRETDSLLTLVHAWRVPSGPPFSRPKAIYVAAIAGRWRGAEAAIKPLPQRPWQKFKSGPLALWLQALRADDPRVSRFDFVAYDEGTLTSSRRPRAFAPPSRSDGGDETMKRRDFGMLHESPDGNYVLDPFVGVEVTKDGSLGYDADTGFAVFEKSSGDLRCYWVSAQNIIQLADWVDATGFVFVGTSYINCPDYSGFAVPAIWFGDVEDCRVTLYVGDPMTPWQREAYRARIRLAWQKIYPRLHFDE